MIPLEVAKDSLAQEHLRLCIKIRGLKDDAVLALVTLFQILLRLDVTLVPPVSLQTALLVNVQHRHVIADRLQ